ncbi:MAG: DUF393 domain-containing protein, partial [Myxococcales bacterium]|nr:DUF393 domain-containing protein [Myxococcales bacterium]
AALLFAPLQGETADLARRQGIGIPGDLSTVALYERGEVSVRSEAIFRVAKHLRAPARWLRLFRFLPRFLTDAVYRGVARVRYRI